MQMVDPEALPEIAGGRTWSVLRLPGMDAMDGLEFARKLGIVVAGVLSRSDPGTLVVFGGDTVFGIVEALGRPSLRCAGEVVPGVPAAVISAASVSGVLRDREHHLLLVSKAGGFGAPDVLVRIREEVTRE
jgi:uncharacterized protein YgbK (DUF1537 family)